VSQVQIDIKKIIDLDPDLNPKKIWFKLNDSNQILEFIIIDNQNIPTMKGFNSTYDFLFYIKNNIIKNANKTEFPYKEIDNGIVFGLNKYKTNKKNTEYFKDLFNNNKMKYIVNIELNILYKFIIDWQEQTKQKLDNITIYKSDKSDKNLKYLYLEFK
jgi:hypothetical protein